jgi:hypothetical protein
MDVAPDVPAVLSGHRLGHGGPLRSPAQLRPETVRRVRCSRSGLALLICIAVRSRASKVGFFDLGAAAVGIGVGLWASLMVYTYPTCGPRQLCVTVLAQRFAVWQSALIGAAVTTAILVAGAAVDTDFRHVNFRAARTMQRWLFKDLSGTASTGAPGSDASSSAPRDRQGPACRRT